MLVSIEDKPSKEQYYRDITTDDWFYDNILIASKKGLLEVYTDDMLQPKSNVTKAELAYIIAEFLGLTAEESSNEQFFTDIKGHIIEPYINQLYKLNIFTKDSTLFNPDKVLTRADTIIIINKMLHRKPITDCESSFVDLTKGHWAFGDIEAATRSLAS